MTWLTERRGLLLPALGFGCGGVWGMEWFDDAEAKRLVRVAVEAGASHLDTGPSYCGGNAEVRLGRALKHLEPGTFTVSTKVGSHLDSRGRIYKDYSAAAMERSLHASLQRLGLGQVDLLLIHGPLDAKSVNDELYEAVERLRRLGLTRTVGASCDGLVAERVVQDGVLDALMTTRNDIQGDIGVVERASQAGMHVLAKSPLGSVAVQFPKRPVLRRRNMWYNARLLVKRHRDILASRRLTTSEGARGLEFTLGSAAVSCAVAGTVSELHLKANIAAAAAIRSAG